MSRSLCCSFLIPPIFHQDRPPNHLPFAVSAVFPCGSPNFCMASVKLRIAPPRLFFSLSIHDACSSKFLTDVLRIAASTPPTDCNSTPVDGKAPSANGHEWSFPNGRKCSCPNGHGFATALKVSKPTIGEPGISTLNKNKYLIDNDNSNSIDTSAVTEG